MGNSLAGKSRHSRKGRDQTTDWYETDRQNKKPDLVPTAFIPDFNDVIKRCYQGGTKDVIKLAIANQVLIYVRYKRLT